jgi:hypothetical protein
MSHDLTSAAKHLLRLIRQGASGEGGWAPVSRVVWPLVEVLPSDLVEREAPGEDGRGRARLTMRGDAVVDYL